jgi:hypothetical protein
MQVVESVEELLDRLVFAFKELDIVHEQDVDVAVTPFEGVSTVGPHGIDELVEEGLGRDVTHAVHHVVVVHIAGDGLEKMGLSEPGIAIDEQRVELSCWHLGDGLGRGVGESV